jgi:hypothetical protein
MDRRTRESVRKVSPCRYELSYLLDDGSFDRRIIEKGCLVDPVITATVRADGRESVYSYSVRNGEAAQHDLHAFRLETDCALEIVAVEDGGRWEIPPGMPPRSERGVIWSPARGLPPGRETQPCHSEVDASRGL